MSTDNVRAAIGVIGTKFVIERVQGWDLSINNANSTKITILARSFYGTLSPSAKVYFMKVRFIVSCHIHIDIDYGQLTFSGIYFLIQEPIMSQIQPRSMVAVILFTVGDHMQGLLTLQQKHLPWE